MVTRAAAVGRPHILALFAIVAVGAALRFVALGHQSFWFDEVVTVSLVRKSLGGMLSALPGSESAPPTYYTMAWLWSRAFGTGEFALRSFSALVGTMTIPVAYLAGVALVSRRTGLLVAGLAATSPLLVWYSQETRAYSLVVLFGSLSFLFFVKALQQPTVSSLAWWAVFSILAFTTHYFAGFMVIAEAGGLLLAHRRSRALFAWLGVVAVAGLVALPLSAHQARVGGASWIGEMPLDLRSKEVIRMLTTPAPAPLWAGTGVTERDLQHVWWIGAALLVAAMLAALLGGTRRERAGTLVAVGIGSATVVMPIVLGILGDLASREFDYVLARNLIVAWLPLAVLVAAGLGIRRLHPFGVAAIAVLCAASLAVDVGIATRSKWQRDDWRLIAARLGHEHHAVVIKPLGFGRALQFYDRSFGPLPPAGERIGELDFLLHASSGVLSSSSIGTQLGVPKVFAKSGTERIQNWTLVRFQPQVPVLLRPGDLGPASEVLLPGAAP